MKHCLLEGAKLASGWNVARQSTAGRQIGMPLVALLVVCLPCHGSAMDSFRQSPLIWGKQRSALFPMLLKIRGGSEFNNYDPPPGLGGDEGEEEETGAEDEWFDAESVLPPIKEYDGEDILSEVWEEEQVNVLVEAEKEGEFGGVPVEMAVEANEDVRVEEETLTFTTQSVLDDPAIDENDSSTYVDRMDLADAYDEDMLVDTDTGNTDAGNTDIGGSAEANSNSAKNASSTGEGSPAQVSVITDDMRKVLTKDLKYRTKEVEAMKPEIAQVVVAKKLQRPYEGMPENWYRNGKPDSKSFRPIIKMLPKIAVPLILGALAIAKGPDIVATVTSPRSTVLASSKDDAYRTRIESTIAAASTVTSSSAEPQQPPARPTGGKPAVLPVDEHTSVLGENHPHSVKPGSKVPVDDELDVTWLDKLITAVERKIKAVFAIEL